VLKAPSNSKRPITQLISVVISSINSNNLLLQIGAVVITPTRELAVQIDEVLSHFLQHIDNKFTHMLFIGGNNPARDVERYLQHGFVHFAL